MLIKVRDAVAGDCSALCDGNARLALETENHTLPPDTLRAGVRALLGNEALGRYFVAESEGEVAGQIMVTYEWSDWRNATFWWIQSVYVWPQYRRHGVFTALYDHVRHGALETAGVCGLRLYVMQDNEKAQATYERCGMFRSDYVVMEECWADTA
ncbi:MAG: GNAT family N-acetyltransferase [Pseudomonadota bacterium]